MRGYHNDPERTDVIKSGGMNVSSQEVQRVLQTHGKVLRAAVVGVPDDYWSERVTAFVIAPPGSELEEDGLRNFCRGQVAVFKVPKSIHIVEGFPTDA